MNKILPPNILNKMSPADRRPMGKAGVTNAEALAKQQERLEKDIHKNISNWLNLHNIFFIRSRMDRKTTNGNGLPDYVIVLPCDPTKDGQYFSLPSCLMVEVKRPSNKLSQAQVDFHDNYLEKTKFPVRVVYSAQECIEFITPYLPC